MTTADWIAADWGTTHLRAWAMGAEGEVLAEARGDQGMGTLQAGASHFEPALLHLIEGWLAHGRTTQVVACGMVGSRQGWCEASYLKVPAKPHVGEGMTRAAGKDHRIRVHIANGVSQAKPPDVMRGEETQIAGLLSLSPGFEGVVAMPGTHTKWVQIVGGEIFHFASFLTGELFALLSQQSILRHSVDAKGFDPDAFATAFEDALAHPERVAAKLFSLRAEHLLQGEDPVGAASTLSGLLVGLEFGGAKPYWLGQEVALVAENAHAERYALGLDQVGAQYTVHDPDTCVLAGLRAARDTLAGTEVSA